MRIQWSWGNHGDACRVPPWRRRAKLSRPEHHALCYLAEIDGLVVRNAAIY